MKILCTDLEGTLAPEIWQELGEHLNIPELNLTTVSYTHLTLPTNREV